MSLAKGNNIIQGLNINLAATGEATKHNSIGPSLNRLLYIHQNVL